MKFSKVICSILVCIIVFSLLATIACAEGFDAKVKIEYSETDSGNILVTASLNDIKAKKGVIVLEYDVLYDKTALKLVNAKVNIPDKWKSKYDGSDDESSVQDLSMLRSEGFYTWSIFTTEANIGITEDKQLFIVLEFEKLNSSTTKIEVANGSVITEYQTVVGGQPTYQFYQLVTNDTVINIDLSSSDEPDINTEISSPIETLPHDPVDESTDSPDTSDSVSTKPLNPLKPPANGGTSENPEDPEKPQGPNKDGDPNIEHPDDQSTKNTSLFWILGIIAAVVSVFVVVYIIVVKKSKGSNND